MASAFKRNKKRGSPWYAQWFDHKGNRKTKCTGTTDKAAALRIARKFEADAALRREGVIDVVAEKLAEEARLEIEGHIGDFKTNLESSGATEQYVRETDRYIRSIVAASGFLTAADIEPIAVQEFAKALTEAGKSNRTVQANLKAMKAFTKWLVVNNKLPRDPLVSVKCPNPKKDKRRQRRIVLPDEWERLEPATRNGPKSFGMEPEQRYLLYATGMQSGLRSSELRSLTPGKLVLNGSKPYILCDSTDTKNGNEARQYIDQSLAVQLRAYLANRKPGLPVFDLPDETDMAGMLRADLARAREAWLSEVDGDPEEHQRREESDFLAVKNHDGKTLDFHSLRHTCGAWLAMTGAHPKVVQTVMRHSTITLTMDTYGHLFPSTESDAVERVGALMNGTPSGNTPPDGQRANRRKYLKAARGSQDAERRDGVRRGATRCENGAAPKNDRAFGKPRNSRAGCDPVRGGTMPCSPQAPLAQLAEQLTLNQ